MVVCSALNESMAPVPLRAENVEGTRRPASARSWLATAEKRRPASKPPTPRENRQSGAGGSPMSPMDLRERPATTKPRVREPQVVVARPNSAHAASLREPTLGLLSSGYMSESSRQGYAAARALYARGFPPSTILQKEGKTVPQLTGGWLPAANCSFTPAVRLRLTIEYLPQRPPEAYTAAYGGLRAQDAEVTVSMYRRVQKPREAWQLLECEA